MEVKEIKKLYYSISEISQITELKQYVLRYWETEFSILKPKKNKAGNRIYKEEDLNLIIEIKNLLHNRKFTIKGAQQYLSDKNNKKKILNNKIIKLNDKVDLETIKNIKQGLNEISALLENFKD